MIPDWIVPTKAEFIVATVLVMLVFLSVTIAEFRDK